LLAEYAATGSEVAFRALVTGYTDLVYSTAIRLVSGDTQLAQEVAQTVFIDLARTARNLPRSVMLGGWLHRHTRFVAANLLRSERRRRARERQAVEMSTLQNEPKTDLSLVSPVIDEAVDSLGAADRSAIILRFFEQRDLRSVGSALGISENAARMRVNRALERLHSLITKRGAALSATALAGALAAGAVTAAPPGLATGLASAALSSAAAAGSTLTFFKVLTMLKLKYGIITALVVTGAAIPSILQYRATLKLREENRSLRQQTEQLNQQLAETAQRSNQAARAERSATPQEMAELLRLRGEVGTLKRQLAEVATFARDKQLQPSRNQPAADSTEQQREMAIARLNFSKQWMLAFTEYAAQNQGLCPTNFEQAAAFWSTNGTDQFNLTPDQFEIVYQGSLKELPMPASHLIVIREKQAMQSMDGGWHRAYGFADGHSEIHKANDGNFEPWEAEHMVAPGLAASPGQ